MITEEIGIFWLKPIVKLNMDHQAFMLRISQFP